jgi:aryl-alcohol dehydrogenase-like predicted oxidoreductase
LARGSVASGLLIDKPVKPYLKYTETHVATAAKAIENISGPRSKAQSAIQFALSNPAITAAIVGIRTMEQLKDAVDTLNVEQITETELAALKKAIERNQYTEHR